jgi:hypothetical protein
VIRALSVAIVVSAAGAVFGVGDAGSLGATTACQPLPARLVGLYRRVDNSRFRLEFTAECTFRASDEAGEQGGGDYARGSGDATAGTIVFSNDRGCRQPGYQDVPTAYTYAYRRGVLTLAVVGGTSADLCASGREGRARELEGHDGFVKSISGRLTISLSGKKSGRFRATGAFADAGSFVLLRSKQRGKTQSSSVRLSGENGTLTIAERITVKGKAKGRLTWSTVRGAGGYFELAGGGTGQGRASRQTLRGDVNN